MFGKRSAGLALMGSAAVAISFAAPGQAAQDDEALAPLSMAQTDGIKDSYVVMLKADGQVGTASTASAVESAAASVRSNGGTVTSEMTTLGAFGATLDADQLEELRKDPRVESIAQDRTMTANEVTSWGLDRSDQRDLPLDGAYNVDGGEGVTAYIIDTGINSTHSDYADRVKPGYDAVDGDTDPEDCQGHGTHVAGTVAGSTYGIAPKADVVGVRVLDCDGSGSMLGVIAGMDWVAQNHEGPSVANMSLGGGANDPTDEATNRLVEAGVFTAVAAGNDAGDACMSSPARAEKAFTVGATNDQDALADFSNYGSCVNINAPGEDITSAWIGSSSAENTISGTSMASPHVAGAAALLLSQDGEMTPDAVGAALTENATKDKLADPKGSPNDLLYVGDEAGGDPGDGDDGDEGDWDFGDWTPYPYPDWRG